MAAKLVKDLMTTDLETLAMHETVDLAATIIALARIRHLPVTDHQDQLRGLVTHRDVLEAIANQTKAGDLDLSKLEVREIMRRDLQTVSPDMKLSAAAQIMFERKYGCLPVLDDGKLVGIITEADFVYAATEEA